jgi:squalene-associated FAD-dependent desaturase
MRVHVIGAGLAGLSAALELAQPGVEVILWEGARQAGGRCRSYHDAKLGRVIDNGNHLVLSGNRSVARYLRLAGAPDSLEAAPEAAFPFADVATGERWTVRINDGPLPWWPLAAGRRPAGVGLGDFVRALPLLWAREDATIAEAVAPDGVALARFWEPMSFAVMNLPPHLASARLMAATAREAWRDGRLCRPMFANNGLGAALVEPAVRALASQAELRLGAVLKAMEEADGRIAALRFDGGEAVALAPGDAVVLAVPPARLNELWPEAAAPEATSSILNAHFVPDGEVVAPPILGVTSARTQWIFGRPGLISLTISAAEHVDGADEAHGPLLDALWAETKAALGLPPGLAYRAGRIVHERRATFCQTPQNVRRRAKSLTRLPNLVLAGDHIDTGLPATIEGAVRSGATAARLLTRNDLRETSWQPLSRPRDRPAISARS